MILLLVVPHTCVLLMWTDVNKWKEEQASIYISVNGWGHGRSRTLGNTWNGYEREADRMAIAVPIEKLNNNNSNTLPPIT